MDLYDAANLDIFSLAVLDLIFTERDYFAYALVLCLVLVPSFLVFVCVLDHGNTDHEH